MMSALPEIHQLMRSLIMLAVIMINHSPNVRSALTTFRTVSSTRLLTSVTCAGCATTHYRTSQKWQNNVRKL